MKHVMPNDSTGTRTTPVLVPSGPEKQLPTS